MIVYTEWTGKVWAVHAVVGGVLQMYMAKTKDKAVDLYERDNAGEMV